MKEKIFLLLFCGILGLVLFFFTINVALADKVYDPGICSTEFEGEQSNTWCVQDGPPCNEEHNFCEGDRHFHFGCKQISVYPGYICICDTDDAYYEDCQFGCAGGNCVSASVACNNNGIREGDELCDGDDFGGEDCESLGLGSGDLDCKVNCTFDTSGCSGGGDDGGFIKIEPPINATSFEALVGGITNFIFNIALVLAPLMIIVAGIYFVTAAGDPKKIEQAKGIILYTLIGLFVILLAKGFIAFLRQIL